MSTSNLDQEELGKAELIAAGIHPRAVYEALVSQTPEAHRLRPGLATNERYELATPPEVYGAPLQAAAARNLSECHQSLGRRLKLKPGLSKDLEAIERALTAGARTARARELSARSLAGQHRQQREELLATEHDARRREASADSRPILEQVFSVVAERVLPQRLWGHPEPQIATWEEAYNAEARELRSAAILARVAEVLEALAARCGARLEELPRLKSMVAAVPDADGRASQADLCLLADAAYLHVVDTHELAAGVLGKADGIVTGDASLIFWNEGVVGLAKHLADRARGEAERLAYGTSLVDLEQLLDPRLDDLKVLDAHRADPLASPRSFTFVLGELTPGGSAVAAFPDFPGRVGEVVALPRGLLFGVLRVDPRKALDQRPELLSQLEVNPFTLRELADEGAREHRERRRRERDGRPSADAADTHASRRATDGRPNLPGAMEAA
jgi:hypothetical protein